MPSRARTSSEGTHPIHTWVQSRSYLAPHRPQSLYVKEISHSPPAESPMSPPSAACSTDSAGSSISIDDPEPWPETDTILGRYSHSLTPDEAIAEENYDDCPDSPYLPQGTSPSSYLPMAPISSDDGYVDMSPRGRHTNMSPAASISSMTSGTPSTDMRFAEYPLEKVSAYFTPSEEETSSTERPIRAYSVGSRPETRKNKARFEILTSADNSRARAFSVGSKTRKIHTRVLPPHGTHVHPKPKSSSAPILSGSRTIISHNSDDPMNDLMELDFSKTTNNSGYVDMTPTSKTGSGYVEMRPGFHDTNHNTEVSPYVDMRSGSSPAKQTHLPISHSDYIPIQQPLTRSNLQEYVDMEARTKNKNNKYSGWSQTDYMDMNFQSRNNKNIHSSSPKYNDDSPLDVCMDYLDMGFQNCRSTQNKNSKDGYVEMSLGKQNINHQRQSSFENGRTLSDSNDDYTNMSVGSNKKKERRTSKKEKTRSQPIQIQNPSSSISSQFPISSGSSISPVYSSLHVGRKYSTGTPPKMYLPISSSGSDSYSSLPRQRTRKNSRRDSNNSSSSNVTTPSSSSTIFPISLNSPSSPIKSESSSASSGIKIPTAVINLKYKKANNNSDYTVMDFDRCSKDESDYVNYNPVKCNRVEQNHDYAIMRPGSLEVTKSSEIKTKIPISSPSALSTQLSSMVLSKSGLNYDLDVNGARCFIPISETREDSRFGAASPKPGDLAPVKSTDGTKNIEDSDYSQCQSPVAKISRPNSVNSDSTLKNTSRPGSVGCELTRSSLSRPSSATSELGSSSSTIVGSRPDSVNSDRTTRPSSVNIEGQLHYASLDLASTIEEDGANKSPNQTITESGFAYAEIDFIKSNEGFKHNVVPNNAKVKH